MINRRRGFFYGTRRSEIYVAVFLGLVSSAYLWYPVAQQLELSRKNRINAQNDSSESTGNKN